jgi:hypothetical protein
MKNAARVLVVSLCLLPVLLAAGCNCRCEVECQKAGGTYGYKTVEMKRSECRDLNDVGNDSCRYHCAD